MQASISIAPYGARSDNDLPQECLNLDRQIAISPLCAKRTVSSQLVLFMNILCTLLMFFLRTQLLRLAQSSVSSEISIKCLRGLIKVQWLSLSLTARLWEVRASSVPIR